ncbi:unnamed protein product [Toxocara canis]|uniref:Vacuolar fusion protein MON1 homolog n=1 Tax=Toxocara canis TaxID=6265 RepID=A0A183VC02_TOXCA|nr:unnamed protein product [Toxocara canis]
MPMLEAETLNDSAGVPGGTPIQENALASTLTLHQHDSMLNADQVESAEGDEEEICDEECLLAGLSRRDFTVFVLSEAGKPIFASCGHEEQLCSLMALVQTFVMVVASWSDCLMRIRSSDLRICFSHRNPLILCIVSRDEFQLNAQVDLLYKQVSWLCFYIFFGSASSFRFSHHSYFH